MAVEITWINHASFRLAGSRVVYIDPWKLPHGPRDGHVVFVSHSHHDHFNPGDIQKVCAPDAVVVAPPDTASQFQAARSLAPGQTLRFDDVSLTGVPAYNVGKDFHPQANDWLGAIIELDNARVYYAGDTDRIPEMAKLEEIDVALLPVGGKYTMNASEAAEACDDIGCAAAVPYHFGDIVGSADDARQFADAAGCTVHVLKPGQSVTV